MDAAEIFANLLEEDPSKVADENLKKFSNGDSEDSGLSDTASVDWFKRFKDRAYIGRLILKDLIKRRDSKYDGKDIQTGEIKKIRGYYLKASNREVGLLSQLYAGTGLFTLLNRFNVFDNSKKFKETDNEFFNGNLTDDDKGEVINNIKSVLYNVLDLVEKYGYDLKPYVDDKTNNDLFHGKNEKIQYIGAMTWALSFFVSARNASRSGLIDFSSAREASEEKAKQQIAQINDRILKQIKYIIQFLIDNSIGSKDDTEGYYGWGYANGCTEPSLFFTYSVIEAYNDFEDNVLLTDPKDEELLDYINEGIDDDNERLEIKYRDLCIAFGDRTWNVYKDKMKDNFFSDKFDGLANVVTKEEILNSGRSTALFNNLYIIFIMFYARVNERDPEAINGMNRSLQLVQNFYDDLKAVGNDSIVDTHIISFNQKNELVKEFSRYLKDVTVQASSLLPMLVKANNLIASWILKYPQQSMSRMFEEMIKNTLENEWLWEDPKFDLLSTERYIEAIGDFYDYYDVYERTYVQKAQDENAKKINRKAEIAQLAEKRAEVKLKEERKILEKSIREEIENSIRSEYILENALIELIDKKVKEKSEQIVVSKLYELFNGAIDYKKATDKADVDLTEEQKSFSDLLSKYVESYLFDEDDVNAAIDDYGVSERIIKVGTFEDLAEFRKTYLAFIAKHHKQIGDKTTLSKIFDLIDKKDK